MKHDRLEKAFILIRILAMLIGFIPVIMIFPFAAALLLRETKMIFAFAFPMIIITAFSLAGFFSIYKKKPRLDAKDGFLLVFLTWVLASIAGAIPFYIYGLDFYSSIFESACTFATTGGTTIFDIESLPRSLLLWRSIAHWFGGIGIILVSVALLPILGVGGFQLIKAEETGPEKEKITPKVTATAQLLLLFYSVLTVILFALYLLGGMELFDALCQSLATMATGGVSIKNQGLAAYNSAFIEAVTTFFMLIASVNFSLYYLLMRGKIRDIMNSTELKVYIAIFLAASVSITVSLIPVYGSFSNAFRYASFQSASILSTAGYTTANYEQWTGFAKMMIFCLMFIGGCSGSTAGGIKVIRHAVLWKQIRSEMQNIIYPNGIFNVYINKRVGRKDVVYSVAGFIFIYFFVMAIVTLITAASGIDLFSSLSASLSIISNIGVGFGVIGPERNYSVFAPHIKLIFSFVMIAGRLEMWTVFILFTKDYWRK